jgi:hypothetical protein
MTFNSGHITQREKKQISKGEAKIKKMESYWRRKGERREENR